MLFRFCIVALLLIVGCSGTQDSKDDKDDGLKHGLTEAQAQEVLATIGDKAITVGEFADRLGSLSPYIRARFESPERRREFLDNFIRFELLVHEAKKKGYGDQPEIVRTRRQAMVKELIAKEVDEKLSLSDVSQAEMKAYYDAHKDEFDRPAQMRASHILLTDKKAADQMLKRARDKKDIKSFRAMAKQHSKDEATAASGGDLQFFAKDGGEGPPAAIRKAAFSLKKTGDVYDKLVKTDSGYHLVMLTGKRPALTRTLEQAKRSIRHKLLREKKDAAMASLLDRLRAEIKVEIDEEALKQVRVDTEGFPKQDVAQ